MDQKKLTDDFDENDKQETSLNIWKYKEQDEIMGVVTHVDPQGPYGLQVTIDSNLGDEPVVLPSLTQLNTQLRKVQVGNRVKIKSLGKQKSGKSKYSYETFDVWIKSGKQ